MVYDKQHSKLIFILLLSLWEHLFITISLYLYLIFLNPHVMCNFENPLLEVESYSKMTQKLKRKLYKDYIIFFGIVTFYFFILLFYRMQFDYYPYPFTKTYDIKFWIFVITGLLFCFLFYFCYRYLTI